MSEIIENVADTALNVSKGKKLNKYLPFILVGAGAGLFMFFKNRNNITSASTEVSNSDMSGDIPVNSSALYSEAINQAIESNNKNIDGVFSDFYDISKDQQKTISELTNKLNEMSNKDTGLYNQISQLSTNLDLLRITGVNSVVATPTASKVEDVAKTETTKAVEKTTSLAQKVADNQISGIYTSQVAVNYSDEDQKKLDSYGKSWATNNDLYNKAIKAGDTKKAEIYKKQAETAHQQAEKLRQDKYGFSGGDDGSNYIKK